MLSADYQKVLEKIVLERKKESMRSAWIGQLVAESLGGGINSRKEIIDLWLLQVIEDVEYLLLRLVIILILCKSQDFEYWFIRQEKP